eukprot:6374680-Amphidinium_carterae.2
MAQVFGHRSWVPQQDGSKRLVDVPGLPDFDMGSVLQSLQMKRTPRHSSCSVMRSMASRCVSSNRRQRNAFAIARQPMTPSIGTVRLDVLLCKLEGVLHMGVMVHGTGKKARKRAAAKSLASTGDGAKRDHRGRFTPVSYTHLRAHETEDDL